MSFEDLRKKHAVLIKAQEDRANAPGPGFDWGSFEMSLPDISHGSLEPAAADAKKFLEELKLSPVVRVRDQIRTLGDSPAKEQLIRDVRSSLVTVSFGLPTGRTKSGAVIGFAGRVHVLIASKWMHLSLFVYASNPRGSGNTRYEQIAEVPAAEISKERFSEELSRAIDWILSAHAKPYG